MTEKKRAKYRVGVIGGGRMGTHHARAYDLNPMTEVVAVADTDPENLELFCERFNVPGYSTYGEMFAKERIDIAAPVLPVKAHPDAVVASARAGVKAVFCEKPMTASLEDADRMVEECRSRGTIFAAGVIPRNYPEYWKARDMLDAGEIGDVWSINIYDPNGQGGCHGINLALMFAGDPDVDWVVGWVGGDPLSDGDGDGDLKGIGGYIRFINGIECFCHIRESVRTRAGESGQGLEVVGAHGLLYNDSKGLHIMKAQDGYRTGTLAYLREVEGVFQDTRNLGNRGYDDEGWQIPTPGMRASVQGLVDALETGDPPRLSTGESLRKALEICIALRESHRHGFSLIKFPLKDRSLKMYPVPSRWNFKKDVYGRERYMADLAARKRP